MTDHKRIHEALEQIAGEAVPESTDLWPEIRARASSMQHTQPVRVVARRPNARPPLPALRPALVMTGAALAMLLCVVVGFTLLSGIGQPGGVPQIGLALTQQNTGMPSPAANPTGLAEAVNATVTAFQPEATRPAGKPQPTATPEILQLIFPTSTPGETSAATAIPMIEITEIPPQEDTPEAVPQNTPESTPKVLPTVNPTPQMPVITGLGGPAILGEQTLNNVTVTLDWAYLDEERLFFQYSVQGLPDESGLDQRGAARVTGVSSPYPQVDLTGVEPDRQTVISLDNTLVIRETRRVQHAASEGEPVAFGIDITAGGVTLPRTITGPGGETVTQGVEIPTAGVFHFDVAVPFQPTQRLEPKQVASASDVRMELNWVRVSPSETELGVCFNLPSPGDWQLDETATLQLGQSEPVLLSEQGLDLSQTGVDPTATPLRRCLHAFFTILYDGTPTTATITIPSLSTPSDFVGNFEYARSQLLRQGIEIERVPVLSGFEIQIVRRPEKMSEEEANRRLFEAASREQPGPWVFTIPVPGR